MGKIGTIPKSSIELDDGENVPMTLKFGWFPSQVLVDITLKFDGKITENLAFCWVICFDFAHHMPIFVLYKANNT